MAAKTQKNQWGFRQDSLLGRHLNAKAEGSAKTASVIVQMGKAAKVPKDWQKYFKDTEKSLKSVIRVAESEEGTHVLISPLAAEDGERDPLLKASLGSRIRDAVGGSLAVLERLEIQTAEFSFLCTAEQLTEALLGLELGLYRFKRIFNEEKPKISLQLRQNGKPVADKTIDLATQLGRAINLARHLTNLPPNHLNPVSYADFIQSLFAGLKWVTVEVWDEKRLEKEKMGLHLAVGQGASTPPRFVYIRYRPPGSGKRAPVALVGKGITFDTGGLDIKPSSGMRLMKKDMGGSAAIAGVAYFAALSQIKHPLDCYLALAENSLSGNAFRPSDVIRARSGHSVEIHNTDAEGRLVLADALDVAVTQPEKPRLVIDVATLTGAIKVALGSQVSGLFSNDTKLASSLSSACQKAGDYTWLMPLIQKYRSSMNSPFADFVNAVDGFGGAVTAALFLETFVRDVPWAHFDIYAWKDSADGAWLESGGNGQMVAGLSQWLKHLPQGR